jgi:hypothetical protein
MKSQRQIAIPYHRPVGMLAQGRLAAEGWITLSSHRQSPPDHNHSSLKTGLEHNPSLGDTINQINARGVCMPVCRWVCFGEEGTCNIVPTASTPGALVDAGGGNGGGPVTADAACCGSAFWEATGVGRGGGTSAATDGCTAGAACGAELGLEGADACTRLKSTSARRECAQATARTNIHTTRVETRTLLHIL